MQGMLSYDGDGNMIATAIMFRDEEGQIDRWHKDNPVIGRLTVSDMTTVLEKFGVDDDLNRNLPGHAEAMAVMAAAMEKTIQANTIFIPFVNASNNHHDLGTAMVLACEPGPGTPALFRLTT